MIHNLHFPLVLMLRILINPIDHSVLHKTTSSSGLTLYGKEVMPCVLSPLGFHLSLNVKQKIWNGEYVDLLTLLPSSKEFTYKIVKGDEKNDDDKRKKCSKSIYNWLQAFFIFSYFLALFMKSSRKKLLDFSNIWTLFWKLIAVLGVILGLLTMKHSDTS